MLVAWRGRISRGAETIEAGPPMRDQLTAEIPAPCEGMRQKLLPMLALR
jgi:hypothetical protein